ncbi:MAG: hypothetical protein JW732_09785 [Dehalococcoidia bacterium]|nr:hypothetical protein [Dehalococcoidia bacterium]
MKSDEADTEVLISPMFIGAGRCRQQSTGYWGMSLKDSIELSFNGKLCPANPAKTEITELTGLSAYH